MYCHFFCHGVLVSIWLYAHAYTFVSLAVWKFCILHGKKVLCWKNALLINTAVLHHIPRYENLLANIILNKLKIGSNFCEDLNLLIEAQ